MLKLSKVSPFNFAFKRSLSGLQNLRSIRETLDQFSRQEGKIQPKSFTDIIHHHHSLIEANPEETEIDQLYELVGTLSDAIEADPHIAPETKDLFYNTVISKVSKYDFASSLSASRKLDTLQPMSLSQIIKYNPGRVLSSWEYFVKYGATMADSADDSLYITVLNKVVHGDKVDIQEGETKLTPETASRALQMIKVIKDQSLIPTDTMEKLISDLIELNLSPVILVLKPKVETVKAIINNAETLTNYDYLYIWNSLNAEQHEEFSQDVELILKFLKNVSATVINPETLSEEYKQLAKDCGIEHTPIDNKASTRGLIDYIKSHKLDSKTNTETDSQVRLAMLRATGFYCNDLKATLELYNEYQLCTPNPSVHLNQIQSLTSMIVVHDSIQQNKPTLLQFAEALIPQTPFVPSRNLSSLILHHAWFGDMDKSLDIYNKSLNLFMDKSIPENQDNRGMLIQSLILCSILGNDLELAQFIKAKAKENQLYGDKYDVGINQYLKQYGDMVETTPDKAELREKVGKLILNSIREMTY